MNLTAAQAGILIVITLVASRLLTLAIDYFFKKATRDDFVTKTDCDNRHKGACDYVKKDVHEQCSRQGDAAVEKLIEEMRTIRGILLAVASKAGVPIDELKELVQ